MPRDERPNEQEAVRTTIVGGRPPGSGKAVGPIPRGIEVLVKKAAVDPAFKQVLLEKRAKAANEIGLKLEPAEVAMINVVPAAQLETIIASSNVTDLTRSAFLGRAAAVMLAALGVTTVTSCSQEAPSCGGIRPEPKPEPKPGPDTPTPPDKPATQGIRPDKPLDVPPGQETEPPPPPKEEPKPGPDQTTRGIRPDVPDLRPAPGTDQATPKEEPVPQPPPKPGPDQVTRGVRPDIPMTKGIQPDDILPPGFGDDEIKKRVGAMVTLLANPEENVRTEAKQALLGMGPSILPALKEVKAPNADAGKDVQAIVQALEAKAKK